MEKYSYMIRLFVLERVLLADELVKVKYIDNAINTVQMDINLKSTANENRFYYNFMDRKLTNKDFILSKILSDLAIVQMYTDYYLLQKYKYPDKELIKEDFSSLKRKFINNDFARKLINSTIYMLDYTKYEKILLLKNIKKEDHEYLLKLNPFYGAEKEMLEKKVDLDLIFEELESFMKNMPDQAEKTYFYTTTFLFELYEYDKENVKKVIKEMMNYISDNLYIDIYTSSKNVIEIDGQKLDEDILCKIIYDFYCMKKINVKDGASYKRLLT